MTFENLKKDSDCDCLQKSFIDNESTFARVIKSEEIVDNDFKSHWDKGKKGTTCIEQCGNKGISISKIESEPVKNKIIELYRGTFKMAPKYKSKIIFFKLIEKSGVIKHTPSNSNVYHHDFYKSDLFTLTLVEVVESTNFNTSV